MVVVGGVGAVIIWWRDTVEELTITTRIRTRRRRAVYSLHPETDIGGDRRARPPSG